VLLTLTKSAVIEVLIQPLKEFLRPPVHNYVKVRRRPMDRNPLERPALLLRGTGLRQLAQGPCETELFQHAAAHAELIGAQDADVATEPPTHPDLRGAER
jgi:hypothetical protein